MNFKLSFLALMSFCFIQAQETTVELSLQPDYTDEVYYDLSENESYNFSATDWEIAFLRISETNMAIRINDGIGIEVFEASNDIDDWETIDVSEEENWTQLYNSDTSWNIGAFDNGSEDTENFGFGWGLYDPDSHKVLGKIVFVLKYADNTYRKLFIEEYFYGYTFRYATWDEENSSWTADETHTVSNDSNPDAVFNYYNFTTESEVNAEPASDNWDLVFRKYSTDLGGMMYPVTGVLHHPYLSVAENVEETDDEVDPESLEYSEEINTIGYDWKTYTGSEYELAENTYYYVKNEENQIYRLHFTGFEGGATGNLSFTVEDLGGNMSTSRVNEQTSFSIYPNPSTEKQINIVYENGIEADANLTIFNLSGAKVYETQLKNDGFYNQAVNLSQLASGTYLVKVETATHSTTQKLVLN